MSRPADSALRDVLVIGSLLAPEGAAAYLTAMRWWGWGEGAGGPAAPAPDTVTFMTPKRKQAMHPELLGVRFELVFIKPERMFGAQLLGEPGQRIRVTDCERTVVDMFDRSDLCARAAGGGRVGRRKPAASGRRAAGPMGGHALAEDEQGEVGGAAARAQH